VSAASALVQLCARLLPLYSRERCREEWLSDLHYATAEGINSSTILAGVIRATIAAQKERPMFTNSKLTIGRTTALAALGLPALAIVGWVAIIGGNALVAAGGALAILVALWAVNLLANKAAHRLRSVVLPWAIYAAVTTGVLVGVAAIAELNLKFNAMDAGSQLGWIEPIMIATGVLGVTAVAAFIALAITMLVKLGTTPHYSRAVPTA
jgi:hypothetical protein